LFYPKLSQIHQQRRKDLWFEVFGHPSIQSLSNTARLKKQNKLGAGGSHLEFYLLRRQRSIGSWFKASPGSQPLSQKTLPKKRLVEWLKVKALSSNPVVQKRKQSQNKTIK
jgi:hypothetical protein